MNYFLQNSSKAKKVNEAPSFNDQLVLEGMNNLCVSLFRKKTITELDDKQKAEVLKQLRFRFSSDPNQIARISGISYEQVCNMLETI